MVVFTHFACCTNASLEEPVLCSCKHAHACQGGVARCEKGGPEDEAGMMSLKKRLDRHRHHILTGLQLPSFRGAAGQFGVVPAKALAPPKRHQKRKED
jgi:hypothetical protein